MYETRSKSKLRQFENNSINRKYSKDSFDRFGDDLCQLLLSYLSIEEKIRFECVSKQWRELVFNKQQKLKLCVYNFVINKIYFSDEFVERLVYKSSPNYKIKETLFESLLKKFKFIKEIEILGIIKIDNKILQIISSNCNNLEKIVFEGNTFSKVTKKQIKAFGQKYGKKLKFINFSLTKSQFKNKFEALFEFTPNIERFCYENLSVITSKPNKFYSKLKKIKICANYFENYVEDYSKSFREVFKNFVDNYCKQIEKIDFDIRLMNNLENNSLTLLSRFESLQKLHLYIEDNNLKISLDKGLVTIGKNCKKMKDF